MMGNGDRGTGITHTDHRRSERPPSSLSSKPSDEWKKKKVISRLAPHISNTQQNQSPTRLESTSITSTHKNQPVKKNGDPPTGITHIKHTAESITDTARIHIHHSLTHTKKEPTNEGKSLQTNRHHTGSRHTQFVFVFKIK